MYFIKKIPRLKKQGRIYILDSTSLTLQITMTQEFYNFFIITGINKKYLYGLWVFRILIFPVMIMKISVFYLIINIESIKRIITIFRVKSRNNGMHCMSCYVLLNVLTTFFLNVDFAVHRLHLLCCYGMCKICSDIIVRHGVLERWNFHQI